MMPVGNSKTAWNSPTTPGSSRPGDKRTSTVVESSKGVLEHTAALMRSHVLNRISEITPNPHTHTPRIAIRVQSVVRGSERTNDTVSGNGWVIRTIMNEAACVAILFGGAHPRWLPRLISKENGTKNFKDATSHKQ